MRNLLIVLALVAAIVWLGPTLLGLMVALFVGGVVLVVDLLVGAVVVLCLAGLAYLLGAVLLNSLLLGVVLAGAVLLVVGFSMLWPLLLVLAVVWVLSQRRPARRAV
ncbi:hypothetical protein Q3O60_12610 [Alkalimonas collagenimarina]|uniref:Phage holin family protein n=1 Tax=Alkalimonas collagenimarina TaxID=400390 RepID=A0ABT9H136_9GAMM|nr:hypothetical protein [Alkalimonas collagenimarina]MDP4537035.1 hypothetical protein [Alkalimonas collagenimarina]